MSKRKACLALFTCTCILLSLLASGCATSKLPYEERAFPTAPQKAPAGSPLPSPKTAALPPSEAQPAGGAYLLRNGDALSVKFLHNPELNTDVTVSSDGKISLPLVGEMRIEGMAVPEVHAAISLQYQDFISKTGYGSLLKEGDFFELKFVYNPELNIGARIRSDGKVSLPILGEVQAAGMKPDKFRNELVKKYAMHITKPDVALLVGDTTARKIFADESYITLVLTRQADQEIFVGGEVSAPKVVKFQGRISTLQAIMYAGGVKDTGDLSRVVIVRRGQFEASKWIRTDLSKPLSGESIRNDVVLHSGDVVVVPLSSVAQVDLFVKQYIRDVLPIQSSFDITVSPLGSGVAQ